MKKIISFITSIALISSMTLSAAATESTSFCDEVDAVSVNMEASDKMNFANQMDRIYEESLANGEIKNGSRTEIDSLMEQATFATTDSEIGTIKQNLAQYGIYMYDSGNNNKMRSGSGDVTLTAPKIFYESWEKTWTVTCGGNWKTTNWNEALLPGDVGGDDAFGVGYTNTSNAYQSSVVRASAYISDGFDDQRVSTSNRSDGDGSKGFGFRLQDYIYLSDPFTNVYVGYKWYGSCTYDAAFGSYNGVATAYYVHTYNSAEVSGVSFGLEGKTAGISVEVSSSANSFTAYSNDKTFGVY